MARVLSAVLLALAVLSAGRVAAGGGSPLVGGETEHSVEPGEYLYAIARRYSVSYPSIVRANRLADPNLVRAGTRLVIPTRSILPVPDTGETIVINVPEFRLYRFEGTGVRVYPVAVGLTTWQTPRGTFEVVRRVTDPAWYMSEEMAGRLHVKREFIPPGPLNPLGDRWIGTSLRHIGIHSTNQPMSIGRPLSHGCVRLYPVHARELFEQVSVGERGRIVYEPVKAAAWEGELWLEAHEDVYGLLADYAGEFDRLAAGLGWRREWLDGEAVRDVLESRRGVPAVVGSYPVRRSEESVRGAVPGSSPRQAGGSAAAP